MNPLVMLLFYGRNTEKVRCLFHQFAFELRCLLKRIQVAWELMEFCSVSLFWIFFFFIDDLGSIFDSLWHVTNLKIV